MNTLYKKDGKIKQRKHIVLYYEDRQVFNPSEEELLENGWEKYELPQPTEEEIFQREKQNKLTEIQHYDVSNEVNGLYIGDNKLWLDRSERETLARRFNIELNKGKTNATLWKNGIRFTLDIDTAIRMLDELEYYAIQCYDNTQEHLVNVNNITSMEELENYDYRTGYPEMLRFNYSDTKE
jgi:hypothetical protein